MSARAALPLSRGNDRPPLLAKAKRLLSESSHYGEAVLLVSISLMAALAIDWFVAPWTYPVAAVYGVTLLIAARRLPPRAVAACGVVAFCLSAASNNVQRAPTWAWLADDLGLLVIGYLAMALSRERQAIEAARLEAERTVDRTARLQQVTAMLSATLTPEEVASTVIEQGMAALGACSGSVAAVATGGARLQVLGSSGYPKWLIEAWQEPPACVPLPMSEASQTHAPIWLRSISDSASCPLMVDRLPPLGIHAFAAIPLSMGDRVLGSLSFGYATPQLFSDKDRSFILALAQQCAQALERARLFNEQRGMIERLQRLDSQLQNAERARMLNAERERIARELHDRVQQTLFAIGIAARLADGLKGEPLPVTAPAVLEDIRGLAAQGMEQVRAAIFALSRAEVDDRALVESLWASVAEFRQRTQIEADLVLIGAERRLSSDVMDVLHAVAREALANVERHARASAVVLHLAFDDEGVALTVQDDGVGASQLVLQNLPSSTTHFGLRGLRERLLRLGGEFVAQRGVDSGFLLRARIPISGGPD